MIVRLLDPDHGSSLRFGIQPSAVVGNPLEKIGSKENAPIDLIWSKFMMQFIERKDPSGWSLVSGLIPTTPSPR